MAGELRRDDSGFEELYRQYVRYETELREFREQAFRVRVANARASESHDEEFLRELKEDIDSSGPKSADDFRVWWSSLDCEGQAELRRIYAEPLAESVAEHASAFQRTVDRLCGGLAAK